MDWKAGDFVRVPPEAVPYCEHQHNDSRVAQVISVTPRRLTSYPSENAICVHFLSGPSYGPIDNGIQLTYVMPSRLELAREDEAVATLLGDGV